MTDFKPGDDVTVEFDGLEHIGVVEQLMGKGWLRCKILIDSTADYGAITPRLGIESVVCVRETDVRHPELDLGSISARLDPQPTVCVPEAKVRPADKLSGNT